mgnify:CR=1 FL=1
MYSSLESYISPAEDPLVPHVLDVHRVYHLGTLHLDVGVHPVGFKSRKHGEFLLDSGSNNRRISDSLIEFFVKTIWLK